MNRNKADHIEQSAEGSGQGFLTHKKRHNYKKELEAAIAERDDLRDKLLRTAADFDNYRKRVQQEKSELFDAANAELIRKLLPVLDDLERLAEAESESKDPLTQGVNLIRKSFSKILQNEGLCEMDAKGAPFDPSQHDALMTVDADDVEPNTVIEEHQKGYIFKNRILRHAKVIVSKEKE